jgi:adenine-specific DNA-methyltransferase
MSYSKIYTLNSIKQVFNKFKLDKEKYIDLINKTGLELEFEFSITNFEEIDLDYSEFDRQLNIGTRLSKGAFFTGISDISIMLDMGIKEYELINKKKYNPFECTFLESSIGSGNIVIEYLNHFIRNNIIIDDISLSKVLERMYLFEMDNESIIICFNRILLLFNDYKNVSRLNLLQINFLDWNSEQTFDFSLQNPPYIGEKGNKELFRNICKTSFGKENYNSKMDIFHFFIHKTYLVMKENGVSVFLTSNYFFTSDGGAKIRNRIKNEFFINSIFLPNRKRNFVGASVHYCIYTLSKYKSKFINIINEEDEYYIEREKIFNKDKIYIAKKQKYYEIINVIEKSSISSLGELVNINQGLVSGLDRVQDHGVFVLKKYEIEELGLENSNNIYRIYKNSNIKKFRIDFNVNDDIYVLYLDKNSILSNQERLHLENYKELLNKRREVEKGTRKWYEITWPREKKLFSSTKIVVPQRSSENTFALSTSEFYGSGDIYYITPKDKCTYKIETLTLYLNSKLLKFYLGEVGKKKGELYELYSTPLKEIPVFSIEIIDDFLLEYNYEKVIDSPELLNKIEWLILNSLSLDQEQKKIIMEY